MFVLLFEIAFEFVFVIVFVFAFVLVFVTVFAFACVFAFVFLLFPVQCEGTGFLFRLPAESLVRKRLPQDMKTNLLGNVA